MLSDYPVILRSLIKRVPLAKSMIKVGLPTPETRIPTAGIRRDLKTRKISLFINPEFWNSLTNIQKEWLIFHEFGHIFFKHQERSLDPEAKQYPKEILNQAMDICINEYSVRTFFAKEDFFFGPLSIACFCESFPQTADMSTRLSYLDYAKALYDIKDKEAQGDKETEESEPDEMSDEDAEELIQSLREMRNEMLDYIAEMPTKEKEAIIKDIPEKDLDRLEIRIVQNKNWRKLMHDMSPLTSGKKIATTWTRPNYKTRLLPSGLNLPARSKNVHKPKALHEVAIFLDFSGSCNHTSWSFLESALSFPKAHFKTRIFAFFGTIMEIKNHKTLDRNFNEHMGGWMDEHYCIIHDFCSGTCPDYAEYNPHEITVASPLSKYPDTVIVFTDGQGKFYKPDFAQSQHSSRWKFIYPEQRQLESNQMTRSVPEKALSGYLQSDFQ